MSSSPIEPTGGKWSDIVKLVVSVIYVIVPLLLVGYRLYNGQSPDTIVLLIVLAFMVASGYVVFGEKRFDSAIETAKDMRSDGGEEED